MLLQLPEHHEALWELFPSKLRAQIKRPQRAHPEVLRGGAEYLDDFYTVFARNMRDLGTPVYGRKFFSNILKTFPRESTIVSVRLNGKPVAAAFLIGHGERLEIPWASTIKEVNRLSVNMLLYWEVLKLGIDRHYRVFDFGRSSRDSGTFRFKQQWGARAQPLYWHYWLRGGGKLPELNPDNPKYAVAINAWKRLPIFVANRVGPAVVKYLP
jgi:FemAB-related protein (PEP-CTERM system-associated)